MFYLCSFASTVFKLINVVESNYIYPKYFDEISCMILRFYNHIMYHPFFARIVSEFTNFNHETLWKFPVRAPNLPVSKIYFCIFVLEISGWFFFNMKIVKSNQTARLEKILNSWFDSGVISKFIFCQCPIPFKGRYIGRLNYITSRRGSKKIFNGGQSALITRLLEGLFLFLYD